MAKHTTFGKSRRNTAPENPRENMEPSELSPEDARQMIYMLHTGIRMRVQELPAESFDDGGSQNVVPFPERAKQHYGNDVYQLISGIEAGLEQWDESGRDVQELKEKYGGMFVEGVEIGERLAVYEDRDFTFVE